MRRAHEVADELTQLFVPRRRATPRATARSLREHHDDFICARLVVYAPRSSQAGMSRSSIHPGRFALGDDQYSLDWNRRRRSLVSMPSLHPGRLIATDAISLYLSREHTLKQLIARYDVMIFVSRVFLQIDRY